MADRSEESCRLCEGRTHPTFSQRVLGRYDVSYSLCDACGSLQTEAPYWLSEAYADGNLALADTGAGQRNLNNLGTTWMVAKILGCRDILDFGGGDGLLCRLLRDLELNCYVRDEFASATYVRAFTQPTFERPELVLAFEVMEHLPDPRTAAQQIFGCGADAVLATTELYAGQDASWWYFVPEEGQHVFFYSERAVRELATRFEYDLLISGGYLLFARKGRLSALQRSALRLLLRRRAIKVARVLAAWQPAHGTMADFYEVRRRAVSASSKDLVR